eukprot:SAG31_NODE_2211_length_6179_cov_2.919572_12_plen_73_part_00
MAHHCATSARNQIQSPAMAGANMMGARSAPRCATNSASDRKYGGCVARLPLDHDLVHLYHDALDHDALDLCT